VKGRIHLGTSGYVYRDWRGVLYSPQLAAKNWLCRYCAVFDTVELNATFYRLPSPEAVDRWRELSPPHFRFAAKGSRFLTHMKRLTDTTRGLERFYERVSRLKDKLEVVLWQLPPQMKNPDLERLDNFLKAQPKGPRQAVEFRAESWYTEEVCRLLDARGAAFCEHDLVRREIPRPTGGFRYRRFHGTAGKYLGRYGAQGLAPFARDLRRWRGAGKDAYVYFNNDTLGAALYDVRELARMLGAPLELTLPEDEPEARHGTHGVVGLSRDLGAHERPAL
jgi:uncharacterized protein YecE (DUF72 family)